MSRKFFKYFLCSLLFTSFFTSCDELRKFQTGFKKTQNQVRRVSRVVNRSKKALSLNEKGASKGEKQPTTEELIYGSVKQKNMLNSYDYLFDGINGKDNLINSSNFEWDSVQKVYYVKDKKYKKIDPEKEVFGWHPYWMKSAWENYSFELLSTISYFSYKVDPKTGSYDNPREIQDWKRTQMIDSAKKYNTKVLLTVSSHGLKNNKLFLDDTRKWRTLIDSVISLVQYREADGVDLNFEEIPRFSRRSFNLFVEMFRENLDNKITNKPSIISITLPAVDRREVFDFNELQQYADMMVIMGYDYNTGSKNYAAIAPLESSQENGNSLSKTLDYYLENGLNPSKTVLALPYYGSMWEGKVINNGLEVESTFKRKITYREIKALLNEDSKEMEDQELVLDPITMTNYYDIYYADDTNKQFWFDDDYTLGKKYDFALSKNLKGVGIWALGYDNGRGELWEVIDKKFAVDAKKVINPITQRDGYPIRISRFLNSKRDLIIVIAVFFTFAIIIGFVILLSDWKVRDALLGNQLYRILFMAIVFSLLTPLIYLINDFVPMETSWIYYLSFFLGALFFYIISLIKIKPYKKP